MRSTSYIVAGLTGLLAFVVGACATTGATFQSGVAPKSFDRPPFYAGVASAGGPRRVAHLPVRYQRGAEQAAIFEPRGGGAAPVAQLIAEMNRYLDSLRVSVLVVGVPETGTPPDTRFGCTTDAAGDCAEEGEISGSNRELHLSIGRPSAEWSTWLAAALDSTQANDALVITLELGHYWPRQKGLSLSKEVLLGTGYAVSVPWLTSLEKPVAVVQLTGALVARNGRALRIGAEGLMAKRTNIGLSSLGVQSLISDDDIEQLRTLRRDDLPGQPLVWQTALRTLVIQLTGAANP
jgi:hypothetical protein